MTIIEITVSERFEKMIVNGVVLVDFGAPWYGSCKAQEPIIKKLAENFKSKVKVVILNIDNLRDVAKKFNIINVPTSIIFLDGEECERFIGIQPEEVLVEAFNRVLIKYDKKRL